MDDLAAELARLRTRAYGPSADIADDPDAIRRLQELESAVAAERWPAESPVADPRPVGASPDAAGNAADTASAQEDPSTTQGDESAAENDAASVRRGRWNVWLPALWAVSLLVVGTVAAVHSFVTTSQSLLPIPRDAAGAQQVAVLAASDTVDIPRFFGESGMSPEIYEEFAGLTVISTNGWAENPEDVCLIVMRSSDFDPSADYLSGPLSTACGAGSFPAAVSVRVTGRMPEELRNRFPTDSSLQFVLDGDRVGVFSDAEPGE